MLIRFLYVDAFILCLHFRKEEGTLAELEKEYQYYLNHKDKLLERYRGRVIAIVGEAVVGDYSSKQEAYVDQVKQRDAGNFLIQSCDPDEKPWMFHSRVSIV